MGSFKHQGLENHFVEIGKITSPTKLLMDGCSIKSGEPKDRKVLRIRRSSRDERGNNQNDEDFSAVGTKDRIVLRIRRSSHDERGNNQNDEDFSAVGRKTNLVRLDIGRTIADESLEHMQSMPSLREQDATLSEGLSGDNILAI